MIAHWTGRCQSEYAGKHSTGGRRSTCWRGRGTRCSIAWARSWQGSTNCNLWKLMQHKLMKCFILFIKLWIIVSPFNKMPILAFTRDAVPDLFPLYASQIFKAILVYPFFAIEIFCVRYSRSYQKFFTEKVMTGADTWQILACYSGLFIFFIYQLHYIIQDHTRNCFWKMSWPRPDYISDSKDRNIIVEDKN